ncbi:hypothetical protein CTAYLR_006849 [Chrysophaeum taylorii]|uniref:Uncharacterized protein n=1 Tax=Chrysophaeum taylorii TaxID=2483200 RepID=A0AAD7U601_9STRA|nr:hypothetical protein CTAYLR_006849 [Chrysophaeum taylorii]
MFGGVVLLLLLAPFVANGFVSSGGSGRRNVVVREGCWRVYDVGVSVEADPGASALPSVMSEALEKACRRRVRRLLRREAEVRLVRVVRKSLDTRKKRHAEGPRWTYVVDAEIKGAYDEIPGALERAEAAAPSPVGERAMPPKATAIVVGCGPAGILCALELAELGVRATIFERGEAVERRGADIGRLVHRRELALDSNFAFGEGGAGTWSDGKLTTRVGRNADDVRRVLSTLVAHGAPEAILTAGAPHLGTDTLVKILRSMRARLESLGVDVRFGSRVASFEVRDGACEGVVLADGTRLRADAVVVATGHSAEDTYAALREAGATLEAKALAVGFRVEHPQALVNKITYGRRARLVHTGKRRTDAANLAYCGGVGGAGLPVASYRLAANAGDRSVYSFCMCPGGQIVPASTSPDLQVVNGMSFSRRDSLFANAALVVTVAADDPLLADAGPLRALAFQRDAERKAAHLGGGAFVCPVVRLTDFVAGRKPRDLGKTDIPSSYRLGVVSADCRDLYPPPIVDALATAALDDFDKRMPGFICDDAILHAVETRTSAPVRVARTDDTRESVTLARLFPCGEGAGYAGGIVSAAVDGIRVARGVASVTLPRHRTDQLGETSTSQTIA